MENGITNNIAGRYDSVPSRSAIKTDPRLQEAAEGMEAQFLQQMIEAMRKTVPESDLLEKSQAEHVFQGMLDTEYATLMSKAGGIGLSRLIVEQLGKK